MITVRFPNGQAVQYNTANHVDRYNSYSDLLTKKDGGWVAHVPNTCIIENTPACRVYNPLDKTDIDERVATELRLLKRAVRELKRKG